MLKFMVLEKSTVGSVPVIAYRIAPMGASRSPTKRSKKSSGWWQWALGSKFSHSNASHLVGMGLGHIPITPFIRTCRTRMKPLMLVGKRGQHSVAECDPFQHEISSSIISTQVFGLDDCATRLIPSSSPDSL